MVELIEFPLDDGSSVVIEVESIREQPGRIGLEDKLAKAQTTFERALRRLQPIAQATIDVLRDLGPHEVGVEFGFKMDVEKGIIIAKAGAEANFKVTLSWKRESHRENQPLPS